MRAMTSSLIVRLALRSVALALVAVVLAVCVTEAVDIGGPEHHTCSALTSTPISIAKATTTTSPGLGFLAAVDSPAANIVLRHAITPPLDPREGLGGPAPRNDPSPRSPPG
jgi:hypothetical protein